MTSHSRLCTIKILDHVNCVLVGLHPDHLGYLYEEFAAFAPNYFFNPKFKLGSWDGKIRYFHKTGKTYVNLLPEIVPKLIGLKYKVKVVDQREGELVFPPLVDKDYFSHIPEPDNQEKPWEMRDYQYELVNALLTNGGGVGIAGTGGGKTSMCAAIAKSYEDSFGYRSIIIVPDKNLTVQTREEYAYFGIDVGEYSGERKDYKHTHIVSTWQSLQNNPKMIQDFQVVIVDECHGLRGKVLTKLLNEYGKDIPHRFGVTGTLPKAETDVMAVKIAVGTVQYTIPAHVLIEQGHLAKLHIDIMQLDVDLKAEYEEYKIEYAQLKEKGTISPDELGRLLTYRKFKDSYFPEWTAEKRFMQTEKDRLEWIATYLELKRQRGNVFCLVNGIAFGKKLAKMIEGAVFLHGADKMKVRKQAYDMFKDQDNVIVIATVNIASTGLNIKRIFNLIYIDMGKSFIRTIQTIGRGLRKAPDKDFVHVTDICSDLKYSRKHLRERIKFYKEAKYPHKKRIVDYSPME